MGWAARLNTTPRDGWRPARVRDTRSATPQALAVFTPTAAPLLDKDGQPRLGPNGKPLMIYGFRPNATSGELLSDTHYFDGRAIRRVSKLHGKTAKRLRRSRRLEAAHLQASVR